MIPELGHFALALACALAFAQAILPIWGAQRRDQRMIAAAPGLATGQLLALATSAFCLVWSHVSDDFSVLNVAENSNSMKPLIYKITGTWGNHEGSIILWALILALCGGAVAGFGRNLPGALRARVIGVLGASSAGFLLFSLLTSNPFERLASPPIDGHDMNPLLQDPGLAFHPPMLYAGYVGFAVPFAFAVAALLEGRVDASWGRWVRPWTLVSWCLLTGGISLGSWWAYYELGWGGFWFWDPVENASLMPWLTGTALLHSAIVVEKREALKIWTVLLAIGTFSLSLSGTFLVRSGILNSVHAFANDPARGVFILALLGLVIGSSLLLFAIRAPKLAAGGLFAPVSREGALVLNNVLLCSIAAVVITGTMYPLFSDLILHDKLSVGAPFFNATVLPLAVPVFAAMAIGPVLPWKRATLAPALTRLWWAALIAIATGLFFTTRLPVLPAIAFGGSAWLIFGSWAEIIERIRLFRIPLRDSFARLRGLPTAAFGAALAHAGMGVTIAGIAGMSLASQRIVLLHPGEQVQAAGMTWALDSLTDANGPNYAERVANIRVIRPGEPDLVMHAVPPLLPGAAHHHHRSGDPHHRVRRHLRRIGRGAGRCGGNAPALQPARARDLVGRPCHGHRRRLVPGGPAAARRRTRASCRAGGGARLMDRRSLLLAAPLGVAVLGGAGFWAMLRGMQAGNFDPRGVPSPITGQPVPSFNLPAQPPGQGFSSVELATGKPLLLNFFASWCVPCVEENPALLALARSGLPIWAIDYKDGEDKAAQYIQRHGNPYQRIARDEPGRVAIDFGLSGVPETFLVDGMGVVRWHWPGPLDADVIQNRLQPAWRALV